MTAEQLGLDPLLVCKATSTGGVVGKTIDAQSVVVAATALARCLGTESAWLIIGDEAARDRGCTALGLLRVAARRRRAGFFPDA